MPLPMVHLATAREYAHDIPELFECPEFYLGSISPDAIHMRENTDRKDKAITHLRLPSKTFPWVKTYSGSEINKDISQIYANGDLWRSNIIQFLKQHKNKPNYNFLLGYGIHLLTDCIWRETLSAKFRVTYESDPNRIPDRKQAYYNDTGKLDFELFKIYKWRKDVWNLLEKAQLYNIDDILTADEINGWNKNVLYKFDSGECKYKNPIKYFSLDDLIEFSYKTGKEIKNILLAEGL